jgi:cation diffusion facilitator CzcD-associated flavoprotein CzcO
MLQLTSYKIFEQESDLGGTWLLNSYPGCACDNLSHLYSLSFAPNYNWSRKYAPQAEILDYLQSTARAYNVYDKVRFNTKIKRMRWSDERKKWALEWVHLLSGEEGVYEADVVVHGTGLFNIPQTPPEFEAFRGVKWHSARWRHDVDLTDKRVGVVGINARYPVCFFVGRFFVRMGEQKFCSK